MKLPTTPPKEFALKQRNPSPLPGQALPASIAANAGGVRNANPSESAASVESFFIELYVIVE